MTYFRLPVIFLLVSLLSSCASMLVEEDKILTQVYDNGAAENSTNSNPQERPSVHATDAQIFAYAERVAADYRAVGVDNRRTRKASDLGLLGLTSLTGRTEAYDLGQKTVAWLGIATTGVTDAQSVINAKGRAVAYHQGAQLIETAMVEYLKYKSHVPQHLTSNGVKLYQRVKASEHMVEKTILGRLSEPHDVAQAHQQMTPEGALPIRAGRDTGVEERTISRGEAALVVDRRSRNPNVVVHRVASNQSSSQAEIAALRESRRRVDMAVNRMEDHEARLNRLAGRLEDASSSSPPRPSSVTPADPIVPVKVPPISTPIATESAFKAAVEKLDNELPNAKKFEIFEELYKVAKAHGYKKEPPPLIYSKNVALDAYEGTTAAGRKAMQTRLNELLGN